MKKTWYDFYVFKVYLTLSWQRPVSYRNQSIDLLGKSMDWFLYDNGPVMKELKWMSLYI